VNVFCGENAQMLTPILEQLSQGKFAPVEKRDLAAKELEEQVFIKIILADNKDVWTKIFNENNLNYKKPNVVLLRSAIKTECGNKTSESVSFYCPEELNSIYGFDVL
jgi:predicted metalloprotease